VSSVPPPPERKRPFNRLKSAILTGATSKCSMTKPRDAIGKQSIGSRPQFRLPFLLTDWSSHYEKLRNVRLGKVIQLLRSNCPPHNETIAGVAMTFVEKFIAVPREDWRIDRVFLRAQ